MSVARGVSFYATEVMTLLLAAIASISLLVGGIRIMNIMLVSVTERTREIGIRLAIGARGSDVLTQFLVESTVMSIFGGLLGVGLGAGAAVLSQFTGWSTVVSPAAVVLALAVSAAVGIFFGFYRARQAASMNPIEALRYEYGPPPLAAGVSPSGFGLGVEITCRGYRPSRPRQSPLFRLVEQHLEDLLTISAPSFEPGAACLQLGPLSGQTTASRAKDRSPMPRPQRARLSPLSPRTLLAPFRPRRGPPSGRPPNQPPIGQRLSTRPSRTFTVLGCCGAVSTRAASRRGVSRGRRCSPRASS